MAGNCLASRTRGEKLMLLTCVFSKIDMSCEDSSDLHSQIGWSEVLDGVCRSVQRLLSILKRFSVDISYRGSDRGMGGYSHMAGNCLAR